MGRTRRSTPVEQCQPLTLEERVEELMDRFKRKAAEDHQLASGSQSEASYHYGLSAAFEVVATMLGEALAETRDGEG
jgi:hypothetical protein